MGKVRLALEEGDIEVFEGYHVRGGAVSEDLFKRGLCLPSGTQMTEEDLERIVKVAKNCYNPSSKIKSG